jgi:hypothetical protein
MKIRNKTTRFNSVVIQLFALFIVLFVASCNEKPKDPNAETLFSGSLTMYCDDEIAGLIKPHIDTFVVKNQGAKVEFIPASARKCMAELFANKARLVVSARDYLYDEDSIMKANNVAKHNTLPIAIDAMVFYVPKTFAYDTISASSLKDVFTNGAPLSKYWKTVGELTVCMPEPNSSVHGNLIKFCGDGKKIQAGVKIRYLKGADSVRAAVNANKGYIGVGYLSQLVNDTTRFKMISVGFVDSLGDYRMLKVHQSSVYRQLYPYAVPINAYLLTNDRNFALGCASYLAYETSPQYSFLQSGIVPAYAKIQLVEQ